MPKIEDAKLVKGGFSYTNVIQPNLHAHTSALSSLDTVICRE